MTPTTENVLLSYRNASFGAFSEGLVWYDDAHQTAVSLDPENVSRAAGIIAALSPLNGWSNNKRKAAQLYAQNGVVTWRGTSNGIGLANSVRKAVAIYNGADPLGVLVRPKTRAFYLTILDPAGDHSPVIDRHAFDIAIGERTNDAARTVLGRKGVYEAFAAVYREAASVVGLGAAQVQAVTWLAWRERYGILR